eukprot:gene497-941_t
MDALDIAPNGAHKVDDDFSTSLEDRMTRLVLVVERRKENFLYVDNIFNGRHIFFNSVHFLPSEIRLQFNSEPHVNSLLCLGTSISKILELNGNKPLITCMIQLFEEWEYYCANFSIQTMKYVMVKNSNHAFPSQASIPFTLEAPIRGTLHKFNNDIVYQYLVTPHVPFSLDFVEVLSCLLNIFKKFYDKILKNEENYINPTLFEATMRIDSKIRKAVIDPLMMEITEYAKKQVASGFEGIRTCAGFRRTVI